MLAFSQLDKSLNLLSVKHHLLMSLFAHLPSLCQVRLAPRSRSFRIRFFKSPSVELRGRREKFGFRIKLLFVQSD